MDVREKLVEMLTDNLPRIGSLPKCDNPLQYTMDEIVERIADHLISNGVAPVRHGRWIERKSLHAEGGIVAKCSACQKDVQYLGNPLNFCPNCGAKIDS